MTSPSTSVGRADLLDGELGPVIRLAGELDVSSASHFERACAALDGELAGSVVVDLRDVTFFDSTALAVLAGLAKASERAGGTVLLAHPPRMVRRLLEVTRMADSFVLVADTST